MKDTNTAPVLFTGHGNPMNAIGNNQARDGWIHMGKALQRPSVILAVSAHWMTEGLSVRRSEVNPQINDMYGFPKELYDVHYEPPGSIAWADKVLEVLPEANVDNNWGIDHGIWSVCSNLFPGADIPVVMISTDINASPAQQFETGRKLAALRAQGALILASGNVVHNLGFVNWDMDHGYPWAEEFDNTIRDAVLQKNYDLPVHYRDLPAASRAVPTVEHYYPFLVALGAANPTDQVTVFNEYCELGSMSMTSYVFSSLNA